MRPGNKRWWRVAVFYQVYPRSFADSDGDGVGDLDGLAAAGWITWNSSASTRFGSARSPSRRWPTTVTTSPIRRDIDPLFGGMAAFERLIAAGARAGHQGHHGRGAQPHQLRSTRGSRRRWPRGPGSDARDRYFFRDGRGPDGALPPNNWESVFGGPAWTRVTEPDGNLGQWYLHLFDTEQPDLNWDNPEVFDDFETDAALLAGPRRGRLPHRRGARDGQAAGSARRAGCRHRGPAPHRRRPALQPAGRARRSTAISARSSTTIPTR